MAREPFEGSDWGERGPAPERQPRRPRRPARPVRQPARSTKERPPESNRRLLPTALIALGIAMVLAAGATVGGFFAFEADELEQPGEAIAAPFELIHDAQRAQIKAAMTAPFVLGVPRKKLERIADCESHGDPRAISSGGLYRGKYQFDRGTWASMGGKGDPAKASELEQDRRAAMLLKSSGSNPWPVCG